MTKAIIRITHAKKYMKNFRFGKFLRFVLITFFVFVEFFSSLSNEVGNIQYVQQKGETLLVGVKALCISHCNSILIWSDFMQKSFHTFKIRYLYRTKFYQKKKCFQIQSRLCTAKFRPHCWIEREKRGVRYSFIYSATSGPSESVGPEGPPPSDFDRSVNQEG